jgi:glutamyl-Q tRNA(Asp) synthetase
MTVTRFAPSPTGYLHLGHAWSAMVASDAARADKGAFLLRIEDIDPLRCKTEFVNAIFEDLGWLGLTWVGSVRRQSEHIDDYDIAMSKLKALGVIYPCFCTRREVEAEAAESGNAPHTRHTGPVYPGTCRQLSWSERNMRMAEHKTANWRLDVNTALALAGDLFWHDRVQGTIAARPQDFGDVVLARKDVPTSYHLSVTVDDHLQGITLVTRGEDLFRATDIHRLLQALLGYEPPDYAHHPLLRDKSGKRFAKRDQAVTLRAMRASGMTADDIKKSLFSQ